MAREQQNIDSNKFYLTREGLIKMKKDYQILFDFKNAKTKGEAPSIFHSEELDPDYLAFLEDIDLLETKLADLKYIIKNAQIIKTPSSSQEKIITLGSKVLVESRGLENEFCIVGTLEADPLGGKISDKSPVGKALLGHKTGDTVLVSNPVRTAYKIKKIKYSNC